MNITDEITEIGSTSYPPITIGHISNRRYAKIIEILDNANWYDGVIALAISGGDFALTHPATRTLVVYAIRSNGDAPFVAPNSGLDFVSDTVGTATVPIHTGVVSTVAAGTTLLHAAITAVPTVEASATLTVS